MRYFIRAVKYFLYLFIILGLLVAILMVSGLASSDPSQIFVGGYSSYWKIAIGFALISAIYPKFGYNSMEISSQIELKPIIFSTMEDRGYKLKKDDIMSGTMVFVKRNPINRALRIWEDAITFTRTESGYELEGHNKELVRCRSAILNRITPMD